ncbi:MAG TPA: ribosome silencing factor [Acidimicrobiia bacterium]|nr:ribosome silencing factor [Acidimicrobiia bacterium]
MARVAADALADKKGIDITMLEVGDLLSITEYFLIATGTSRPHVQALVGAVEERLRDHGRKALRREGMAEAEWVLLDFGDFVLHVFQETPRNYYGLERLWGDAPRIELEVGAAQG